ncbi:MAG: hypothetical protein Q8P68_00990 [Candidatus Peregrinibacteria bacterium]|nr:hypothetical protein [Candidatus Peregrinibacteria bacterium]
MAKKQDHLIARHILEVRLKNRSLSFMDYKGEMGDFIIKKMGWNKLKLTGSRVDITNDSLDKVVFFSWENFGLQIEASENFDDFKTYINKLFEIVEEFKRYQTTDIARIGIKTSVFYHKNGMSLDGIKEVYKNMMLKNASEIESKMEGKIIDTGVFAIDMESDAGHVNFTTGPMSKEEIVSKIFGNDYYSNFKYDNGIYFDIDLSQKELKLDSSQKLKELAIESVDSIEKKLGGFLEYFFNLQK